MRYDNLKKEEIEKIEELSKIVEVNLKEILNILNDNYITCFIMNGDFNMNNSTGSNKKMSIWRKMEEKND